ncbi:hypothetical protein OA40_05605 [Morganella morganii]|uniref:hypothetical protein n=1 Tax=Morganella morganii TaxID=582 RepID=UPI00062C1EF7|nr:hypothetical protein [Morganella morganii]KKY69295.1 hypothetical protein OA40_05605 [Morganella morganii]
MTSISIISLLIILMMLFVNIKTHIKLVSSVSFFTLGLIFYFIIPIIIGENFAFIHIEQFNYWYVEYLKLTEYNKLSILAFSLLIFLAFHLGFNGKNKKISTISENKTISTSWLYIAPLLAISIYLWLQGKDLYFQGYSSGYHSNIMGKLATLQILLLSLLFISKKKSFSFIFYSVLFALNSLLLLSMGGRMYIILSVFSVMAFCFKYNKPSIKVIASVLAILVILVIVGMWRLDGVKFELFFYILFAEPVFTSFSLLSFAANNALPIIGIPINFVNSFVLVLPSFILNKEDIIINVSDMGFDYISPLGATSLFVSLLGNFGVLGSFVFIYLFSKILSISRQSSKIYFQCFYYISCGVIPFMLFRDSFGISLKVMILTGLIFPYIFIKIDDCFKALIYGNEKNSKKDIH